MSNIRPAAVAGSFYPANSSELNGQLASLLGSQRQSSYSHIPSKKPGAFIVPHAGYIYSGSTAASAYALLSPFKKQIKRVVLIGPSHRVWLQGAAIPSSQFFSTPLGNIKLDSQALNQLAQMPQVTISDQAHALEHSLEVQLPFLQMVLNDFELVPVVVGETSINDVSEIINCFLFRPDTITLISSDLSHFHNYQTAQKIDAQTCQHIQELDYKALNHEMACGCTGIQGLLKSARENSMQIKKLAQCNSGDTAGDKSRVVGYASYAIF